MMNISASSSSSFSSCSWRLCTYACLKMYSINFTHHILRIRHTHHSCSWWVEYEWHVYQTGSALADAWGLTSGAFGAKPSWPSCSQLLSIPQDCRGTSKQSQISQCYLCWGSDLDCTFRNQNIESWFGNSCTQDWSVHLETSTSTSTACSSCWG